MALTYQILRVIMKLEEEIIKLCGLLEGRQENSKCIYCKGLPN